MACQRCPTCTVSGWVMIDLDLQASGREGFEVLCAGQGPASLPSHSVGVMERPQEV